MEYSYYEGYLLDDIQNWELSDKDKSILNMAIFLVDNKCSIRKVASNFCVSKSSVCRYLNNRLPVLSFELYQVVKRVLKENKKKYFM